MTVLSPHYLPHHISMFSISGRWLIDRGRGLELKIVHRHIPVMEAGDHHVGVLGADVDTHHAATGRAGELRVWGILQRENTGVARLRLKVEIVFKTIIIGKKAWKKEKIIYLHDPYPAANISLYLLFQQSAVISRFLLFTLENSQRGSRVPSKSLNSSLGSS